MKPIKLTLSGFGPFLKEVNIDFSYLGKENLYLITGPTGSGKTTIFDAIVYCLYGEASGIERKADGFRSDFAKDKDETFAELTFEVKNKIYTVRRNPKYKIEGRSTPILPHAILTLPNGKVLEKINNVNQKIYELIGLNVNQFRQIVMLAQGEFMKLLFAQSSERDEIFRKIFNTEQFNFIEEDLKERLRMKKEEKQLLEKSFDNILSALPSNYEYLEASKNDYMNIDKLTIEIENDLKEKTKEIKEQEKCKETFNKEKEELIKQKELATIRDNDKTSLKLINDELNKRQKELTKIEKQKNYAFNLEVASTLKQVYDEKTNLENQILPLKEKIKKLEQEFKNTKDELDCYIDQTNMIELDKKSLENLKKTKQELEEEKTLIEKIQKIEDEENNLKVLLEKEESINKTNTDSISTFTLKLNKLTKELEEKEVLKIKQDIIENNISIEKGELNKINEYEQELKTITDMLETIQVSKQNFEVKREKLIEKEREVKIKETGYLNNLASILSLELKDNYPCPVCGSLSHPSPHSSTEEVITKKELNLLKEELNKIREEKELALKSYNDLVINYQNKTDSLYKNLSVSKEESLENAISERKKKALENQKENELALLKIKETLKEIAIKEQEKEKLEQTLKELLTKNEKTINEINNLKNETLKKQTLIKEYKTNLKYNKDLSILNEAILERDEAITLLEEAISSFDKGKEETSMLYQELKGKLDSLYQEQTRNEKELENKTKEFTTKVNQSLLKDKSIEELKLLFSDISSLKEINKNISDFENALKNLKEKETQLEEKLKTTNLKETEEIKNLLEEKNNLIKEIEEEILTNTSNIHLSSNYLKELEKLITTYKKVNNDYLILNDLSSAASGKNPALLSFERYVLQEYFDRILNYANIRFSKMTSSRYLLYRSKEKGGRGQKGLDIEVLDFETGKRRDVKTLSGGETFKAALSLALGLADAVEERLGGIEINALFIDEGFGTLDEESLNQAVEVLTELKGKNKVIGVISHVQELQNIISRKLIIEKAKVGSKVKIV